MRRPPCSRAYHLRRLRSSVAILWTDVWEALDDGWQWVRGYVVTPRVEAASPLYKPSNNTQREFLLFHIANGPRRRQVEALLRHITPKPRPYMGLGLPPGHRITNPKDRRAW